MSLEVLTSVLSVTKPLPEKLQGSQQELMGALGSVATQSCVDGFQSYRDGNKLNQLFAQAEERYGDIIQKP